LVLPREYFDAEFAGLGAYELSHKSIDQAAGTVEVGVELRGLLPDAVRATVTGLSDDVWQERLSRRVPLPVDVASPHEHFRQVLERIQYLGPLRSPGERFYVAHTEESPLLDSTGAFLPYVLRDRATDEIHAVLPAASELGSVPLSSALNAWLHYLRTGEAAGDSAAEIAIEETKDVLVEIRVRGSTGEGLHPLADSGFGYSQVLPIIIRGLLAAPGDTLIVEQPELHLHPALQIRLASFFVALARAGRQVILETHSEHLVNAVRVASAEDASGEIARLTAIYFIDAMQHPPHVHEMSIAADGTVPDWPQGFFGEALSLAGRLLRAQDARPTVAE
jgi:predicted ATPase